MRRFIFLLAFSFVIAGSGVHAQNETASAGSGRLVEIFESGASEDTNVIIGVMDTANTAPRISDEQVTKADIQTVSVDLSNAKEVVFSSPLLDGSTLIAGRSLQELIQGTPVFSPIEGLPEDMWKGQQCSSCHAWTRTNLCSQGRFYARQASNTQTFGLHPYGGTFKENVMHWAQGDCQ